MATEKNHSIRHTPENVARYCDAINLSCDAPEEAHKLWVKEQGVFTNQGPHAQLSMMLHFLHKEASALLCEAVQGNVCVFLFSKINGIFCIFVKFNIFCILFIIVYFTARIEDGDQIDDWDVTAQTNHQDMVIIRPPGISDGAFQLRMDNIWFFKLLLLFKIHTKTDPGMQYRECAYVSVLEEYKGPRKSGHILHILHILICLSTSAWLDQCQSAIVYERREQAQVLYVIPVSSVLGRLPLVPVGRQRQYSLPCVEKLLTFPELSAINQQTVVMVVGGGT